MAATSPIILNSVKTKGDVTEPAVPRADLEGAAGGSGAALVDGLTGAETPVLLDATGWTLSTPEIFLLFFLFLLFGINFSYLALG
jgi:hypothetical protein